MRIQPIEPGLDRMYMLEHLPRLVYAGELGSRKSWNRWNHEFCNTGEYAIYHLFDAAGEPVYFGKAWCPLNRFEKHQRKDWWAEVAHLNLYKVTCQGHPNDPCGDLERVALFWERRAIEAIQPRNNIAFVTKGAA